MAPGSIGFDAWTHILHFGMYPTSAGRVAIADMQSPEHPAAAVAAARAAGKQIILVIGGEGTGDRFADATDPVRRGRFVDDVVATVRRYGYDGVSIDWEEHVVDEQLVALVDETRTALDTIHPRPFLSVDVLADLVSPATAARFVDRIDTLNLMSYWSDGTDELAAYRRAGIPADKIVLGVGFSPDYRDTSVERVRAKVDLVRQHGLAGVEVWSFGDLHDGWDDARLEPLRDLVAERSCGDGDARPGTPLT